MAGTPYLCFAVVSFLIYRAFRRKRRADEAALSLADATGAPPSSPDGGNANVRAALF